MNSALHAAAQSAVEHADEERNMDVYKITINDFSDCDTYNAVRRFIVQVNDSYGSEPIKIVDVQHHSMLFVRMSSEHVSLIQSHGDVIDVCLSIEHIDS